MKKFSSLFLSCLLFVACSKEEMSNTPQSPKEYTVSIGVTGEIVEVTETPFSKADPTGQDLYGIQVYSCKDDGVSTTYEPYAYGLFTDISALNVKLLAGYKYKFQATMVVNGTEKISSYSGGFYYPFFIMGINQCCPISTSFTYSTQGCISYIKSGCTSVKSSDGSSLGQLYRPNTERFYGETTDYVPSENGSVKINMGRASYKVKVVATGPKFTEGTVKVTMAQSPDLLVVYNEDKKNDHVEEETYTFYYVDQAVLDKQYSEKVKASFIWIKADGSEVPLKLNHEFEFRRNKQTTITIKVDDTKENGVGVEAADDPIELGDNFTIENGEVIDTPIDPETGK